MDNFVIVRPEHLNHHGILFGGQMLLWIDEYSWLTAARDFPGCRLVTRAMDNISFEMQVPNGSILRFHVLPERVGTTSIRYHAEVHADFPGAENEVIVFTTTVTFVRIGQEGEKLSLPERPRPLPSERECAVCSLKKQQGETP
jgi:acyl-CoA hydrolase